MISLLVCILATWRIAALLTYDYWFEWLRQRVGAEFDPPEGFLAETLSCFWCTSIFAAVPVVVLHFLGLDWVLWPLAISGGAIILNHWTRIVRDAGGSR